MTIRKKIEIGLVTLLGISLMLFIVLLTHLATSTPLVKKQLEISKIEFEKPLSATDKIQIKTLLQTMPGVNQDIIIHDNSVVCFRDATNCEEQKIIQKIGSFGKCKPHKSTSDKYANIQFSETNTKGKFHHLAIAMDDSD